MINNIRAILIVMCALTASCSSKPSEEKRQPAHPDYSKMKSIAEVEGLVPPNLKIAYQNLFSCRYESSVKADKPVVLGTSYAGEILESVRRDPSSADACLKRLRSAG